MIPGQAKYASIFNVSGSEVNALARLQYESFESFREQREGAAGLRCTQSSLFGLRCDRFYRAAELARCRESVRYRAVFTDVPVQELNS